MSINILHLTDLHLDKNVIRDFENMIRKPLIDDIKSYINGKIDLLLITGDIVDKGGHNLGGLYKGLNEANNQVIKAIADGLDLSEESIFIIPGNHDIVRNADKDFTEIGLREKLKDAKEVNAYINGVLEGDLDGVKRLSEYRRFEEEFYSSYSSKKEDTFFSSNFIKDIEGIQVGISCLNSSWRCYSNDDEGRLFVGDQEIHRSKNIIQDCDLKIALIHHHINYLSEVEKEVIENVLLKNYDLVFFGHSHKFNNYSKSKGDTESIWIGSPSAFHNARLDSKEYTAGYSICNLNTSNTKVEYRFFSYIKGDYRLNTNIGKDGFDKFHPVLKLKEENHVLKVENIEEIENNKLVEKSLNFIDKVHFTNDITPSDILGTRARSYNRFYFNRDIDDEISDNIKLGNSILVLGNSLSGKTRAVYEAFEKLTNFKILIPDLNFTNVNLLSISASSGNQIIFFDDIDDFLKNINIEALINKLIIKGYQIIATCRTGPEYDSFVSNINFKVRESFIEIRIPKISKSVVESFENEIIKEVNRQDFDGNIGSLFLPIKKMQDRYRELSNLENPESKIAIDILASL